MSALRLQDDHEVDLHWVQLMELNQNTQKIRIGSGVDRGSTDKAKDSVESDPGDRGDDRLKCFVPMAHSCASLCTLASRSQTGFSKKHTLTSSDSQCDHTGHSKRRVSLLRVLGSRADFCAANAPSLPYSSCYPGYDHCMGSWERIPAKDLPAQAGTCD